MYRCVIHTQSVRLHVCPCVAGANVLAADEEAETCLHLAFARHTTAISLDQADAIQRVGSYTTVL